MTKTKIYSIAFALIFLVHFLFPPFQYIREFLVATSVLAVVFLGLLFLEIYKKNISSGKQKFLGPILLIIWLLAVGSQIEFIPSKKIIIKDVFGRPLENIPTTTRDEIPYEGFIIDVGGGHQSSERYPKDFYHTTDKNGSVVTNARFYFGRPKARGTSICINDNVYSPVFIKDQNYSAGLVAQKNDLFDSKCLSIDIGEVKLTSIPSVTNTQGRNYRDCEKISDQALKNECLLYSVFYSAVSEKNPELCKMYETSEVKSALYGLHTFYLRRDNEMLNECLMLVDGIINGNVNVCDKIKNTDTRHFNDQCKCLFGTQYCEDVYKNEFNSLRPFFTKNVHDYLCEGKSLRADIEVVYKNYPIRYLDTASELYRKMFCE